MTLLAGTKVGVGGNSNIEESLVLVLIHGRVFFSVNPPYFSAP